MANPKQTRVRTEGNHDPITGAPIGTGADENFDPSVELDYWREAYVDRPYYEEDFEFEEYEPAYRYGVESRSRMRDREWADVERDLESDWSRSRGESSLTWEKAKEAVRDAWDRLTGNDDPKSQRRSR